MNSGINGEARPANQQLPATPDQPRYWFPAKRYGRGWGLPSTWQGWVALAVYVGLLIALCVLVPADRHSDWFPSALGTLTASLIAIFWWKGEPPRWRWGGEA